MKKSLLATAPLVAWLLSAPVAAQPEAVTPPLATQNIPATVPVTVADTRAEALALLDKSAAAYAALNGLAMDFESSLTYNGHTSHLAGDIAFDNTGRSRITPSKGSLPLVTTVGAPANSPAAKALIQEALKLLPSNATTFLKDFLQGENSFHQSYDNVRLLPGYVVAATLKVQPGYGLRGYDIQLHIDPITYLLLRADTIQSTNMQGGTPEKPLPLPFDASTTFSKLRINPVFAPDAFAQPKPLPPPEPEIYWDPKIQVGAVPFPISGTDLNGTARDLTQYRGKVLLVDFWATWCGPCVAELPGVLASQKKYGAQGFEVLAISLDSDKKSLTDFVAARKMPWPQLFDGKAGKTPAAQSYGVKAIPFTLLIGKDGRIAAINPRGKALEPAIQAALAK